MRNVLALLAPLALIYIFLHVLWGVIAAVFVFPLLTPGGRDALVRFWSRILLVALGVRLQVEVAPGATEGPETVEEAEMGSLLLLNHISWLDVFVLASVIPVRFVSKSEIAHWPIFGRLSVAVGTLFVERGRRHAVAAVNHAVAHRLQSGQSIGIFPEGTTTEGDRVLRFHANLVQSAIDVGASVRPVALRYTQDGEFSNASAYIGEMTMAESLWRVLLAPRLTAEVLWLPGMATRGRTRHELANAARSAVTQALGLPDEEPLVFTVDGELQPAPEREPVQGTSAR